VGRTAADLDRATGKVIEAQNIEVAVPAKR
jgi:hypothetical protein